MKKEKELTPTQILVEHYKTLKGFGGDKGWDKLYFPRCSKSAKLLWEYLETLENCQACMKAVQTKMDKEGLEWTFETIVKRAGEWKRDFMPKTLTPEQQREEEDKWKRLAAL